MLVALDTSVIVAATLTQHLFHARAWRWAEAIETGRLTGHLSSHALAEVYSVLTKIPGALAHAEALTVVRGLRSIHVVHPADPELYERAAERCAERGVGSGGVYDALHLIQAEWANVDVFLTFNPAHFLRLARQGGPRIVVPPDPPSLELTEE